MWLAAWTDGGGNSTPDTEAYIGVLVTDEDTGKVLWEHGEGIGKATHNVADPSRGQRKRHSPAAG